MNRLVPWLIDILLYVPVVKCWRILINDISNQISGNIQRVKLARIATFQERMVGWWWKQRIEWYEEKKIFLKKKFCKSEYCLYWKKQKQEQKNLWSTFLTSFFHMKTGLTLKWPPSLYLGVNDCIIKCFKK